MITLRGVGLVLVAIVLFMLAGLTRVGWLFLFDAVLWGTILISAIMPWLASGSLQVRRRVTGWDGTDDYPGPMEGDAVNFDIRLQNHGLFPLVFSTAQYEFGEHAVELGKDSLFIAWLGRNKDMSSTTSATFNRRGLHQLPPIRVDTRVPFGLFRRAKSAGEPMNVVVLPKVYPIRRLDNLGSPGGAETRPLQTRIGEQVTSSRDYFPGDPWQHIHWRNTARTGQVQIKEFERIYDNSVTIAFDASQTGQGDDEVLEHAIKIAASAGSFVCRSGGAVRLVAGQLDEETSDVGHLLTQLALLERQPESTWPVALRGIAANSDLLTIVADTDGPGIKTLAQLAGSQRRITAVVLRGFDIANAPANPSERLQTAGIATIECWPGEVQNALGMLEKASHLTTLPAGIVSKPLS